MNRQTEGPICECLVTSRRAALAGMAVLVTLGGCATYAPIEHHAPRIDAEAFRPAQFIGDTASPPNRIQVTRQDNDLTAVIACQMRVTDFGGIGARDCVAQETSFHAELVRRAVSDGRILPAMLNGKVEDVMVPITFVYTQKGETQRLEIYLNYGWNMERYGPNYIGAQRILDHNRLLPVRPDGCDEPYAHAVSGIVSAHGVLSNVVFDSPSSHPHCRSHTLELLQHSRFIPAHDAQGRPVESVFRDTFGKSDAHWQPLAPRVNSD